MDERITVRKMISNTRFMVKYAMKYDRPLVMRIILLTVLLKMPMNMMYCKLLRMQNNMHLFTMKNFLYLNRIVRILYPNALWQVELQ